MRSAKIQVSVLGKSRRGVSTVARLVQRALEDAGVHVELRGDCESEDVELKGRRVRVVAGCVSAVPEDLEVQGDE